MRVWKILVIPTLFTLVIGGIYLLIVFDHRRNPGAIGQQDASQQLTADDVAVVRMEFPQHYDDLSDLIGKSVWMKDGYVIPAFPYTAGKVDFKHPAGLIPPAQRLDIKKVIKAVTPGSIDDAMSHGARQAFYIVTRPGSSDPLAVPVGAIDGNEEQYFSDILFFYDDPRTIYSNWPKDTWAAIDAHQVRPGMSELQAQMALGHKVQTDSQQQGNRTITYTTPAGKWTVTFANNKATKISGQ